MAAARGQAEATLLAIRGTKAGIESLTRWIQHDPAPGAGDREQAFIAADRVFGYKPGLDPDFEAMRARHQFPAYAQHAAAAAPDPSAGPNLLGSGLDLARGRIMRGGQT